MPPAQIARETQNEFNWSQPRHEVRIFIEIGVRLSIQQRSPNIDFCQGFAPSPLGARVCGIFSIGRVWAVIVRPNDRHESLYQQRGLYQQHGKAGGDSGSS
jgi:hypothetical protein